MIRAAHPSFRLNRRDRHDRYPRSCQGAGPIPLRSRPLTGDWTSGRKPPRTLFPKTIDTSGQIAVHRRLGRGLSEVICHEDTRRQVILALVIGDGPAGSSRSPCWRSDRNPGCGREFYREWANQDVTEAVFEKSRDPRYRLDLFSVEPPALARFADPYDRDRPPRRRTTSRRSRSRRSRNGPTTG